MNRGRGRRQRRGVRIAAGHLLLLPFSIGDARNGSPPRRRSLLGRPDRRSISRSQLRARILLGATFRVSQDCLDLFGEDGEFLKDFNCFIRIGGRVQTDSSVFEFAEYALGVVEVLVDV